MEALNFLKFWRERSVAAAGPAGAPTPVIEVEEEEEDSFFDLELSVSDGDKKQSNNLVPDRQQQQPTHDVFSKRKIIPSSDSPRRDGGDTLFSLTRVNGSKSGKKQGSGKELALSGGTFSKRFSTDTIQKYLNRIKPRKSSRTNTFSCSPASSPASSPAAAFSPAKSSPGSARLGLRAVYKNLGKTKSAPATVGIESPARRDDSLIQQNDSIQSAILHCKRSFNSSRESSMLSRSSSDSIKSLSSDCSVLPRYSSDKWIDSARNSVEDGCFISK